MASIGKLTPETLRRICDIIGDTASGLSGTAIGKTLKDCGIEDPSPNLSKRDRLFDALNQRQIRDGVGNNVMVFIRAYLSPVKYTENKALFEDRRAQINVILAFLGYYVAEDGNVKNVDAARTIGEAQERAKRLRKKLTDREVHSRVLEFCRAELLEENYFHAVFEATKSVADEIRRMARLQTDGATLVDDAFSLGKTNTPKLAFNALITESEQSEQKGFVHLLKGLFSMVRNVTAHAPRIKWPISEEEALDSLVLASIIHRKLDKCFQTRH